MKARCPGLSIAQATKDFPERKRYILDAFLHVGWIVNSDCSFMVRVSEEQKQSILRRFSKKYPEWDSAGFIESQFSGKQLRLSSARIHSVSNDGFRDWIQFVSDVSSASIPIEQYRLVMRQARILRVGKPLLAEIADDATESDLKWQSRLTARQIMFSDASGNPFAIVAVADE